MNAKSKEGVVSKRRPRQNIVSMILGHTKSSSSVSLPPRTIGFSMVDGNKRSNSSSSSSRLLRSAIELTRRSKTFTSRHNNSPSRGKKSKTFVKGQRAFYRSTRGIEKVTVVGVHHDAKLVPYYTIQLRDGKEKQTDGKHLNHVKEDVVGKGTGTREHSDKGMSGSESDGGSGGGGEVEVEGVGGGSKSTGSDNETDPMTESSGEGESNLKDEGLNCGKQGRRGSGEETPSQDKNYEAAGHDANKFTVGHDAYYRAPDGIVTKVRIKFIHLDSTTKKNRYTITLLDGSLLDNVKQSQLATLMELSSKELSLLMKERNKRQPSSTSTKSNHLSVRRSSSSTHEDNLAADKGSDAETPEEHLASSTSDLSESLTSKKSESTSPAKSSSSPSESNEKLATVHVPTVRMVQAKTEDGKAKTVPLYEVGMTLNYKNAAGVQECTILSVHLDDLLEPYYDIRLKDGHEKQTDNAHLMLKSDNLGDDVVQDKQDAPKEIGNVGDESEKCQVPEKTQQHSLRPSDEEVMPPSSSKKELVPEGAGDVGCPDNTNQSDKHPKEDPTSASVANSSGFSPGNKVIYTSSEGDQIRAEVLKLHHDKKNRPYYVVRLLSTGKEKQVYGHRLQLLSSSQDSDKQPLNRRSRSRSRGGADPNGNGESATRERGRSTSKASKSDGNAGSNQRTDPAARSDSIDSRKSLLSNSSRRAADRKEKVSSRRERDESRTRDRHAHDPIGTASRNRSMSALRHSRTQGRSSGGGVTDSRGNGNRDRSHSRARVESKERASSRTPSEGRERSRSRAPGEGSRERACSRAPSVDSRASSSHGTITSRPTPTQSLSNSKKLNSSSGNAVHSSKQLSSKGHSATEGDASSSMTGRSIAKLKSFRKNFSAMKKR